MQHRVCGTEPVCDCTPLPKQRRRTEASNRALPSSGGYQTALLGEGRRDERERGGGVEEGVQWRGELGGEGTVEREARFGRLSLCSSR